TYGANRPCLNFSAAFRSRAHSSNVKTVGGAFSRCSTLTALQGFAAVHRRLRSMHQLKKRESARRSLSFEDAATLRLSRNQSMTSGVMSDTRRFPMEFLNTLMR